MMINETLKTSKLGVNLIRDIIDKNDGLFHEIQQENDMGIDAIIELSSNKVMSGLSLGVQIKTGTSYINYDSHVCSFSIGNHFNYWRSYSLPVFGFVCDLEKRCFYFIDIKQYIEFHSKEIESDLLKTISFSFSFFNTITVENFKNLFINHFINETPDLSFIDAKKLINYKNTNDTRLALSVLRKFYYDNEETWRIFLSVFRDDNYSIFSTQIISYLSYGTGNPDTFRNKDNEGCCTMVKNIVQTFIKADVVKLLSYIDNENGFQRGSISEAIDFIIREIPNNVLLLKEIAIDTQQDKDIREDALFLIACYDSSFYLSLKIRTHFPNLALLDNVIHELGGVFPYM